MTWVDTDDGYINLNSATRIRQNDDRIITRQDGSTFTRDGGWTVFTSQGTHHRFSMTEEDLRRLLDPVIPASGDQKLHVIYCPDNGRRAINLRRCAAYHRVACQRRLRRACRD